MLDRMYEGDRKVVSNDNSVIYDYWGWDENQTNCVYIRFMEYEHYLVLCDIEVRAGWRGQGLALKAVRVLESQFEKSMFTLGKFTSAGYGALADKLPALAGSESIVSYGDMGFVDNWENLYLHYTM